MKQEGQILQDQGQQLFWFLHSSSGKHIIQLMCIGLIVSICLVACVGCSSLEPSRAQRAAAVNSPWTEKCLSPPDQNSSQAGIDTWPDSTLNQ
jgi:hypothetical protein